MTFVQARLEELTPCLDGPQGQGMATALGAQQDTEQDTLTNSVLLRYPPRTASDALDILGVDSAIPRFAGEPDGTASPPTGYQGRLMARWPTAKKAGSAQAIIDSLNAYGIPDVQVVQDFQGHYWPGTMYSRFAVIIGPDFGSLGFVPLVAPFVTSADGSCTGGSTATIQQVRAIKGQILRRKAAHSYAVKVILRFGGAILGNINSTPPFTPPVGSHDCFWSIGKLCHVNITRAPFTPGGYQV